MKKVISLLVMLAVVIGMVQPVAIASTEVVFYNAENGERRRNQSFGKGRKRRWENFRERGLRIAKRGILQ